MKKFVLVCTGLLFSLALSAQGNFKVVQQQQAHYPGGMEALQDYFNKHMVYTEAALSQRIYGEVEISFDVSPDSTVNTIVVLQGKGYGIDEEVVRLLGGLKFAPAVANGVLVRSNLILSIYVKAIPQPKLDIEKP